MLETLGYFLIGLLVLAGTILAIAALWANDMKEAGKAGVEGDLIIKGDKAQKEAEDSAAAEQERLEKLYGKPKD